MLNKEASQGGQFPGKSPWTEDVGCRSASNDQKRQISCRHQSRVGLFGGDYGKYHTSEGGLLGKEA